MRGSLTRLFVALALTLSALIGFSPLPAEAASMTCNHVNGAPSSEPYNGGIRYYFEMSCNTVAGVTAMYEDNLLYFVNGGYYVSDGARSYLQTTIYYNTVYYQGGAHGYYQPEMFVQIFGSFSYGSVPGCGRVASNEVDCDWFGTPKYY
jgi:hypothetical protein